MTSTLGLLYVLSKKEKWRRASTFAGAGHSHCIVSGHMRAALECAQRVVELNIEFTQKPLNCRLVLGDSELNNVTHRSHKRTYGFVCKGAEVRNWNAAFRI